MDTLPEEILFQICDDLELRYGTNLRELTLVNRKFSSIATPLLYSGLGFNCRTGPVRCFLRTLVANPNLRPFARRLVIGLWKSLDVDANEASKDGISVVELGDIVHSIPSVVACPLEFQEELGTGLLKSSRDAMVAAVLNLLANLESLCIPLGPARYDAEAHTILDLPSRDFNRTLTMKLIELSTTPLLAGFPLFSYLTYACIKGNSFPDENFPEWDSSLVSHFLRLPALKTFYGFGCRENDNDTAWACDEGASGVTTIRLQYGQIGADTIRKVLRSCHALQDFDCSRSCQGCLDGLPTCDYSHTDIHHELYRHRMSLHTLRLNNQACLDSNQRNEEPITSLAALENLKNLDVDEDALFGYRDEHDENARSIAGILPAGLQHIQIYGEDEDCQIGTFREMGRVILSHKGLQSVTSTGAYLADAEEVVKKHPGVALEVMEYRYTQGYSTFKMHRVEAEEAGCESSHEYGAEEQMRTC